MCLRSASAEQKKNGASASRSWSRTAESTALRTLASRDEFCACDAFAGSRLSGRGRHVRSEPQHPVCRRRSQRVTSRPSISGFSFPLVVPRGRRGQWKPGRANDLASGQLSTFTTLSISPLSELPIRHDLCQLLLSEPGRSFFGELWQRRGELFCLPFHVGKEESVYSRRGGSSLSRMNASN
ncbi:hypothetical protein HPB50_015057 [Hyalomma asiaticum]|uniref:Uncharacterized protein n=1 Tax=Hyalomma asiaticum TaxID=266040 RepID=A0ACB7TIL5_HYAAI|nr:hypothetical protein HPB50_015057 [Hyalomma asiaticum]